MTVKFSVTWFRSVRANPPIGTPVSFTPSELAAWWMNDPHDVPGDKRALPIWCASTFEGNQRALERVRAVSALAFDIDGVEAPMRDVLARLRVACAGHTTWSHGTKGQCYRILVFVSRPMSALEHGRLWAWFADAFASWGAPLDERARDASRAWFVPCRLPSYDAHAELARPVLNVDKALERVASLDVGSRPRERARQEGAHPPRTSSTTLQPSVLERASKYLANMPAAIQGSNGSGATMRAAVAMVRGFALDEETALDLLNREFNPRCSPPWSARELKHKVESAAKATRAGLGYLLSERTR